MGADYEAQVRALWDAYARGGTEALCARLDEDVQWRPTDSPTLHGREEIAAYMDRHGDSISAVAQVFERHGDCVLAQGSLRRFRDGGFLDVQPTWVYFFRAGRLVAAAAYASAAQARAAARAFQPAA